MTDIPGAEVRNSLIATGVKIMSSRWPFTYHHDWFRSLKFSMSRGEAGQIMGQYKELHGEDAYGAHIILGAVSYLSQEQPGEMLQALVHGEYLRQQLRHYFQVLEDADLKLERAP